VKPSSLPVANPVLTTESTLLESPSKHSQSSLVINPELKSIQIKTQDETLPEKSQKNIWGIFTSTFLTIFLAEMGDKTQLATLLMSAESQSPWVVFTGAAMALIATSLIGVLIGSWLSQRLSPKTLETAAGLLLIFISLSLLWDVMQIGG
jgi:putative Ca2+/H+ antiporter (TMEM165/GDT1 family)